MQNNLLRKGRELCSRLDVFVRKALPVFILLAGHCVTKAQTTESDFSFNEGVRYSQWVINSRLNNFYANTTKVGLAIYDNNGNQTTGRVDGKTTLDYVPGLVAKGIIEAAQYYSGYDWAQPWALPWYKSIEDYGNYFCDKYKSLGGSLDDLNAAKLYIPLRELSSTEGKYNNSTTYKNTATALDKAVTGLQNHNTSCRIKGGTIAETEGYDVTGGWWHKTAYNNQMWLDGQYMGGVLLAQLINYKGKDANVIGTDDWDIAVKQLDIVWNMCWNPTDKLMYHAFDANAGTGSESHSETWAGLNGKEGKSKFLSATYWARACGWYFLALVDMLEEMDKAGISTNDSRYTKISNHLKDFADGLKARQDATTGGWYQILDEDGTFSAKTYDNGINHTTTYNYIESSATAIFAAAYLKAIRLKYLDKSTYEETAKKAYQCIVNSFFAKDGNDGVHIFGSCRSAGLGNTGNTALAGNAKYRNGSKEYYLLGHDVAKVAKSENVTEGKVLGAFILAATEYERMYQADKEILFKKDLAPSYDLTTGTSFLNIEAAGSGTPAYQWYKEDGTKVEGATSSTFSPTLSGKYYCEASAGSTTIKSSITNVTVKEQEQPEDPEKDKIEGETEVETVGETTATTLFYTDFTESNWSNASTDDKTTSTTTDINGTTITVTGKNITFDTKNGTATMTSNMSTDKNYLSIPIKGINGSVTIEITGDAKSKFRYSVDIATAKRPSTKENSTTNINNSEISTATVETSMTDAVVFIGRDGSNTIKSIKITTPGTSSSSYTTYTYRVGTNYKTPTPNSIRNIKDVNDNNKTLVSMNFGGWKHNEGTYNNGSGSVTDSWAPAKENSTGLDNFNVCFTGTNDAKDETKGDFTANAPFTLPVRGAFMTMEPTKNGKITAYVMHSGDFYVTNQRGTVLQNAKTGTGNVVKYEFDVKASETYYLFSNNSAMSFCGASFIPADVQPDGSLSLSETEAYKAPSKATGYATITLTRALKANQWNTLTLPFNMTENEVKTAFGEGTQIIILNEANTSGDVVNLRFMYHEIQNILAGYPYLIKPTKEVSGISVGNKQIDPEITQNNISSGSYTAKGTPEYSTANVTNAAGTQGYSISYKAGDIFLSDGNGKLYISQGKSYGKGYRSYIEKNNDGQAAAKSISMSYTGVDDGDGHGTTTSISFTELSPDTLSEFKLGGVYNLNGQKVSETTDGLPKGIYIVNGQKMIVNK